MLWVHTFFMNFIEKSYSQAKNTTFYAFLKEIISKASIKIKLNSALIKT